MIIASTIFVLAAQSATPAQQTRSTEPDLGRDLGCVNSVPPLCVVPFAALLSRSPRMYEKRVVEVAGFMRKYGSDYALFANEEASRFGSLEGAVIISIENEDVRREFSQLDKKYVRVAGMLSLPQRERADFWAELKVSAPPATVAERVDDLPPAPPRPKDP